MNRGLAKSRSRPCSVIGIGETAIQLQPAFRADLPTAPVDRSIAFGALSARTASGHLLHECLSLGPERRRSRVFLVPVPLFFRDRRPIDPTPAVVAGIGRVIKANACHRASSTVGHGDRFVHPYAVSDDLPPPPPPLVWARAKTAPGSVLVVPMEGGDRRCHDSSLHTLNGCRDS